MSGVSCVLFLKQSLERIKLLLLDVSFRATGSVWSIYLPVVNCWGS